MRHLISQSAEKSEVMREISPKDLTTAGKFGVDREFKLLSGQRDSCATRKYVRAFPVDNSEPARNLLYKYYTHLNARDRPSEHQSSIHLHISVDI